MRDFTIGIYEELLNEIRKTHRAILPVKDYLEGQPIPSAFFILRHDVDRRPERARRMAALETSLGIRSTYYFRLVPGVFRREIILELAAMGHEIGYHYEVMHKARGEPRLAAEIFAREMAELGALSKVKTASMHGSPQSRWDNRDFWKYTTPSRFGLVGEATLSVEDPGILYVTDTGRGWNRFSFNIRDRFPQSPVGPVPSFSGTRELMRAIREGRYHKVYLQIHPNRWSSGPLEWCGQWGEDLLLNGLKWLLMRTGQRRISG